MATTPELIHGYISAGLECTHLEVEGDGQHFSAVIVSPAFAGKRRSSATRSCTPRWATACAKKSTRCR
jgi:acid stress-induced BolA-like protein IbaG/YrbA